MAVPALKYVDADNWSEVAKLSIPDAGSDASPSVDASNRHRFDIIANSVNCENAR